MSLRNPIQLGSPSSVPAFSNAAIGSNGDSAAVHAFNQASNTETAEQRSQRLEAELLVLKESIGVFSATQNTIQSVQNETNRLITTLINFQRVGNCSNAQSSIAAPNSQNLQQICKIGIAIHLLTFALPNPCFVQVTHEEKHVRLMISMVLQKKTWKCGNANIFRIEQ